MDPLWSGFVLPVWKRRGAAWRGIFFVSRFWCSSLKAWILDILSKLLALVPSTPTCCLPSTSAFGHAAPHGSPHILEVLAYCAPECGRNLLQPKADGRVRGPTPSLLFPTIWHSHVGEPSPLSPCQVFSFAFWMTTQSAKCPKRKRDRFLRCFFLHHFFLLNKWFVFFLFFLCLCCAHSDDFHVFVVHVVLSGLVTVCSTGGRCTW